MTLANPATWVRQGVFGPAPKLFPGKWVIMALGNINSAIGWPYRKIGRDHTERYFASFAWRYNRQW